MDSTGRTCSLLLMTMAAVSSGHNAREYFQQAHFQNSPARPEDALVFYVASAPPLICELEKDGDWIGGDRIMADLILNFRRSSSNYTCSFEGNGTIDANLELIQKTLPDVFTSKGKRKIEFSDSELYCISDSQLPDDYFQLRVQRAVEERPMKCRLNRLEKRLYLRFPGYPTIICKTFTRYQKFYSFNLPGIVGNWLKCGFQLYIDLVAHDTHSETRLSESLDSNFFRRVDGGLRHVTCCRHAASNRNFSFQLRLTDDTLYDCSVADA